MYLFIYLVGRGFQAFPKTIESGPVFMSVIYEWCATKFPLLTQLGGKSQFQKTQDLCQELDFTSVGVKVILLKTS